MTIGRISGGGPYEQKIGYTRAVVAGGFVFVSGTVGQGETAPEQCLDALATIKRALEEAGSGFDKVVRVTYYLSDRAEFEACWPILRETFGAHPPAATMIECGLIDPRYRVEIEVTALV
ncbi:RidA family protein [Palleronia sp.]|uniref:RidA family protein n=1 Tax=Palleronia sp. TaxID=1940284 RepID=UPI0035C83989